MEKYRLRMHHVGIVLPSIEAANEVMDVLGVEVDYTGFVKSYTADLIFTKYGPNESPIEFIIPRGGVLSEFNNGKGGIAHICIEVNDIKAATEELLGKGFQMLEKEPVEGTEDIIVNFLRPKYSKGILIELAETIAPIKRD
ncbi:MAG: VOC family protein [Candidatus Metalachnospira sp.]|nr:VOC family protein [Candidatus Metalachnospira sp.]